MLDAYREELTHFHHALAREEYEHYSGRKETLDLEPIFDRYGHLFTRETIEALRREREAIPESFESARRALDLLIADATERAVEMSVRPLTERIARAEAEAEILWDGDTLTLAQARQRLATEPDPRRRRELYAQYAEILRRTNELRQERWRELQRAARALGYADSRALYQAVRARDFQMLGHQWRQFLEETDEPYRAHLHEALVGELGVRPTEADRADIPAFLYLQRYADAFPRTGLREVYAEVLRGLGIDADRQTNVEVDDEERPRKQPRAFCVPIRIPEEIKLVVAPNGGVEDYHAVLHEAGHAQHYAWTSAALLPEFKYAGDRALSETYAFLLESLVREPRWLEETFHFSAGDHFLKLLWVHRLFLLRRYAAKCEYEQLLHATDEPEAVASEYAERLTRATGFRFGPEEFLSDVDDGFYAADYWRAWVAEVWLRDHVKTRFGHRWWRHPRAGRFLIELWETGERYTAEEIIRQIGVGGPSMEPLLDEVRAALGRRRRRA
jgi:hypothetical protein